MSNLEYVGLITLWVLGIIALCGIVWGPVILWEARLDRRHNANEERILAERIDRWKAQGFDCDPFGNPIPKMTPEAQGYLRGTHDRAGNVIRPQRVGPNPFTTHDRYGQQIHPEGSEIVPGRFVTPGHSAILVKPIEFPPPLPGCCGMHGGACTPDDLGDCDS